MYVQFRWRDRIAQSYLARVTHPILKEHVWLYSTLVRFFFLNKNMRLAFIFFLQFGLTIKNLNLKNSHYSVVSFCMDVNTSRWYFLDRRTVYYVDTEYVEKKSFRSDENSSYLENKHTPHHGRITWIICSRTFYLYPLKHAVNYNTKNILYMYYLGTHIYLLHMLIYNTSKAVY